MRSAKQKSFKNENNKVVVFRMQARVLGLDCRAHHSENIWSFFVLAVVRDLRSVIVWMGSIQTLNIYKQRCAITIGIL